MADLTDLIGGQHYTTDAGATDHLDIQVITRTAYTALGAGVDPNTLYLITG